MGTLSIMAKKEGRLQSFKHLSGVMSNPLILGEKLVLKYCSLFGGTHSVKFISKKIKLVT